MSPGLRRTSRFTAGEYSAILLDRGKATDRIVRGSRPQATSPETSHLTPPAFPELVPGLHFDERYVLVRELAMGTKGPIWLADHQRVPGVRCVLKIRAFEDGQDSGERKIVVRALAEMRHPNWVSIHDFQVWRGMSYLVMEYLEGEHLGERLRYVDLDASEAYRIVNGVASALHAIHKRGFVHKRLTPRRIFIERGFEAENVKLLDIGEEPSPGTPINDETHVGWSYLSPEQIRGRAVDQRSDLWSLAVIAFQCLTETLPFDSTGLVDLGVMIASGPIPKMLERNSALPPQIEAWWTKATERDAERRFQTAGALADGLAKALRTRPEGGSRKVLKEVPTMPSSASEAPKHGTARQKQIFLCYRREDAPSAVDLLHQHLLSKYASDSVFRDIDAIALGIPFDKAIENYLARCSVVLVVIGPRWAQSRGPFRGPRIRDIADPVRMEIARALEYQAAAGHQYRVIPVLVDHAKIPSEKALPAEIRELCRQNGQAIRAGRDRRRDLEDLVAEIERFWSTWT